MKQVSLDGSVLADAALLHDYLKDRLSFPEYYGRNFDALYDCLTDLEEIEITISAPAEDGAVFQKVARIFKVAAAANEHIQLNIFAENADTF